MINQIITVNFSGGTYSLYSIPGEQINFTIEDTGTLTNNYYISTAETLITGKTFKLYFKANVTKGAFNFNVLGTNLTETQLQRESTIEAVYNGTTWDLNITPNTVSTAWIKNSDNSTVNNLVTFTIPVSFETGEQSNNSIYIPFDYVLVEGAYCITKAIAGTDPATITIKTNGTSRGVTTISASTAIDTESKLTISNTTGNVGGYYAQIVTAKTTAGGKALVTLVVKKV
jgi:hypothetical protein